MRSRSPHAALLLALAAFFVAGCGGTDKTGSGTAGNPRAEVLSYYPTDTPFVAVFATDPQGPQIKQTLALVRRFAVGDLLLGQLKTRVSAQVDFDREVKPLLGNPLAFGAPDPDAFSDSSRRYLFAWMVKDGGKLGPLVDRLVRTGRARPGPEHLGAKVYTAPGGTTLAVRGALVLFGTTPTIVTAALDRHAGADHVDPGAVEATSGDVPRDGLVTGYGNLAPILSRPATAKARRVPWVGALRAYAFSVSSDGQGVKVDFRLDTSGRALSEAELPLVAGSAAPPVVAGAPIRVSVRDLAHFVSFAEGAQALTSTGGAARLRAQKERFRRLAGIDFDRDLVEQLSGNAVVTLDGPKRLVRADVRDPTAMAATLKRLGPKLGAISTGQTAGFTARSVGGGFSVVEKDGRPLGTYGLVGLELLAGNGTVEDLRALAARSKEAVPGAQGAVAFTVDKQLIRRAVAARANVGPLEAPLVLGPVGDVRGWLREDPRGMRGQLSFDVGGG